MHLSLSPGLEQVIAEQVRALGFASIEDYLQVDFGSQMSGGNPPELSDEEFQQVLDELSSEANLSSLPADFSRADI